MVEIRRGSQGAGEGFGGSLGGHERLPWLEPVEDEDGAEYGPGDAPAGYGGVLLAAIGVLIAIAVLTAVVAWWRHHRAATADIGQVIHAPAEPYKVRPADPGGMKPDRNGEVTYGTSAGQDIDSPLDLSALPEQPVASRHPAPTPAPAPAMPAPAATTPTTTAAPAAPKPAAAAPTVQPVPAAAPAAKAAPVPAKLPAARPAPEEAAPAASGPTGTIQLGAFSTEAKANAAWKSLSGRFGWLKGLEHAVAPVEADGKTLYRLRATGTGAPGFCARLRVAGETCAGV